MLRVCMVAQFPADENKYLLAQCKILLEGTLNMTPPFVRQTALIAK